MHKQLGVDTMAAACEQLYRPALLGAQAHRHQCNFPLGKWSRRAGEVLAWLLVLCDALQVNSVPLRRHRN